MNKTIFFICALLTLTGCYRMPTDEDFSVIPTTNNPDITRDRGESMMPNVGY